MKTVLSHNNTDPIDKATVKYTLHPSILLTQNI